MAKRQREKPVKTIQEGPRTRGRTSGETNSLLANPVYIGQALGEKKHTKRGAKMKPLASLLFLSFGWPAIMPQGCIFLCLPNKTEL